MITGKAISKKRKTDFLRILYKLKNQANVFSLILIYINLIFRLVFFIYMLNTIAFVVYNTTSVFDSCSFQIHQGHNKP